MLVTLIVASRVTVAHAGQGMDIELQKTPYLLFTTPVVLAAVTRATAVFLDDSYFNHLGYSALTLFFGILCWWAYILLRMIPSQVRENKN